MIATFLVIAITIRFGIWPSIAFSLFSEDRPWATECVLISTQLTGHKPGNFSCVYWIDWNKCRLNWTLQKQYITSWNKLSMLDFQQQITVWSCSFVAGMLVLMRVYSTAVKLGWKCQTALFFVRTLIHVICWDLCYQFSGAANDHVAAFFQDRPIFVFSDNLGYPLLKNAWYPNLLPPCGGIRLNSIILSFMDKYSSRGLVFFHLCPISFELLTLVTWNLI